ncbi:MAG: tRNA lysidine(34) synthetase TilS, partial [Eubacteriales bacterium]|nr:tRNA lysidine(34) synthetase TilS [Eubacteriales bacterium]
MDLINAVITKFRDTINKYDMFADCAAVLCGFSGGADSTALLDLLRLFCAEKGIRLGAVHVNHMIRGADADRDEAHCARFCGERGIELFIRRADIPQIAAAEKTGTEETARRERYRIFNDLCDSGGFDRIAVAHNAGDNFETVLFNLFRGTGIRGLSGIPPVRDNIVRPLIGCSKTEISGYCGENRLVYVSDDSNADTVYTRNFIRREIIPLALRVNSAAEENVTRMCEQLRRDSDFLDGIAGTSTAPESDAMLTRRIAHGYTSFTGGGRLSRVHIENAAELIRDGKLHGSVSLPAGVSIRKTRSGFIFENTDGNPPEPFRYPLKPGKNDPGAPGIVYLCACPEATEEIKKIPEIPEIPEIKEVKNIYRL